MKVSSDNLLEKPMHWFLKYFPSKIKNRGFNEDVMRAIVLDFKDGKDNGNLVADMVSEYLLNTYDCQNLVFACIPASSPERQEVRYKNFSRRVCQQTDTVNGYWHMEVMGNRAQTHLDKENADAILDQEQVWYDKNWFFNKDVVVFDDVITRGNNYKRFASTLESFGANIVGGVFLAKTFYKVDEPYELYKN